MFFKKKKVHTYSGPKILSSNSNFHMAEAYKSIRSNLVFALATNEEKCKKIVVTSSAAEEGKTITAINLSITFAQAGYKVLLIESDMRKPTIRNKLKIKTAAGLSLCLAGRMTAEEAIYHDTVHGIDLIISGPIPPNPAELIISGRMSDLLDSLSDKYDYIFIDSPPINVVSETMALASLTAGVVLVVKYNSTTYKSVSSIISTLEFANVKPLGFVLNSVNFEDMISKRSRGYGYGYGYGYGASGRRDSSNEKTVEEPKKTSPAKTEQEKEPEKESSSGRRFEL